jgi:hypothetical protein
MVHWYSHVKHIQSSSFKTDVPQDIKVRFYDHIMAHEYVMFQKAGTNPAFAAKLMTLEGFPAFSMPGQIGQPNPAQEQAMGGPNPMEQPVNNEIAPEPTPSGEQLPPDTGNELEPEPPMLPGE